MLAIIRTSLFYLLIAIWAIICGLFGLPLLLSRNPKIVAYLGYIWAAGSIFCLRYVCGVKVKEIGRSNIPSSPFIIASKHQSAFETIFYLKRFINPAFILKRELQYIPIYGWYIPAMGMIGIDRTSRSAIKHIIRGVEKLKAQSRIIIIFPEGTRTEVGEEGDYKSGIFYIQKSTALPTLPIALNSGRVWHKKRFAILPQTITIEYLPPIPTSDDKAAFMHELKNSIEQAALPL